MSYRTEINGFQIFGNGESYPEWLDFIAKQNIEIDNEDCYKGEIHDFMGMLETLETIVLNIEQKRQNEIQQLKEREQIAIKENKDIAYFQATLHDPTSRHYKRSMFDLRNIYIDTINDKSKINNNTEDSFRNSLFDRTIDFIENGYIFMPYQAFMACQDVIERCDHFSTPNHFYCYKIKDGKSITVSAH